MTNFENIHEILAAKAFLSNGNESWHGGKRMVTLVDMEAYAAKKIIAIKTILTKCHMKFFGDHDANESEVTLCVNYLVTLANEADALELPMTAVQARRVASLIGFRNNDETTSELTILETRFEDEMQTVNFFLVKKEGLKYYENAELAGPQFKSKFKKANAELIEAGNCLAFDRATGCVCHLLRCLDMVLTAFEKSLGIIRPAPGTGTTWGSTLRRIKDQMAANDKNPPADWSANKQFFEDARTFLDSIKMSARDDTMHAESSYDVQSATSLLKTTVEALRHFSKNLTE